MDKYLNPLIKKFTENKNSEIAAGQKAYMRNKFDFSGIKTPFRKQLISEHIKKYGKPDFNKLKRKRLIEGRS